MVPNTSVVENAMLRNYQFPEYRRGGLLNYAKLEAYTHSLIDRYPVSYTHLDVYKRQGQ